MTRTVPGAAPIEVAAPGTARKEASMPYRIRLATEDDIPGIDAMIPISTRALSAGHYTERQIESALTYVIGVDSQLIADGTYFVAVSGDRIVGSGGWSRRASLHGNDRQRFAALDLIDPASAAARIRSMFVHPEWARNGIGRRIVGLSEAAARQAGFRRMVLRSTIPGEPLYAALGYAVRERTAIPMPNGEVLPIACMEKVLAPVESG